MSIKPQLDQLGVRLIAVGTGNKNFAQKFQKGLPFEGEVYLDPEANSFRALSLKRLSVWEVTKRFVLSSTALGFYKKKSKEYASSDVQGDGQQTGGVFVVGPKDRLYYSFIENEHEVTEFANPEDILKACKEE